MSVASKFLDRRQAAGYIKDKGLPATKNTLDKLATLGGGPVFRKFGARAVYTPDDLDKWVEDRLSKPMASTSEVA